MQVSCITQRLSRYLGVFSILLVVIIGQACSSGGGDSSSDGNDGTAGDNANNGTGTTPGTTPENGPGIDPEADASPVTLLGKVSFERVPYAEDGNGLDYTAISEEPARRVLVELINSNDDVIAETVTDTSGFYRFNNIPGNVEVSVRASAQLASSQTTPSRYNISVRDNTDEDFSIWSISSAGEIASASIERNLLAEAGWNASSQRYENNQRDSAAFAILDSMYKAMDAIGYFERDIEGDRGFISDLSIYWSPANLPITAAVNEEDDGLTQTNDVRRGYKDGLIGSTFFQPPLNPARFVTLVPDTSSIFVLGADGLDTDEFDESVIVHEFFHYFEENLSRSDSFGGPHSRNEKLDMRVAFSEGAANAFAMNVLDSDYIDTIGNTQSLSSVNFNGSEPPPFGVDAGWFNEASVGRFLFDYVNAGGTNFAKLIALYDSDDFREMEPMVTVHSTAYLLGQNYPGDVSLIDELASQNSFSFVDGEKWASSETNDGGFSASLPIYRNIAIGVPDDSICSTNRFGLGNKLGNRQFFRFNNTLNQTYELQATGRPADANETMLVSDPDFFIWQNGFFGKSEGRFETLPQEIVFLNAPNSLAFQLPRNGPVVVDLTEVGNTERSDGSMEGTQPGDYCYTVSVEESNQI